MERNSANIVLRSFLYVTGLLFVIIATLQCKSTDDLTVETTNSQQDTTSITSVDGESQLSPEDSARLARDEKLTEIYEEELRNTYKAKANRLANFYILAQQRFYVADYNNALTYINRALDIQENAYCLALRGSIHLGLGMRESFIADWRKALQMDENVPIPQSDYIIGALQSYGLIDDNLNKNFTP